MPENHHKHHHKQGDDHTRPESCADPDGRNITNADTGKQTVRIKAKHTPGIICIERHIHDDAVVISGSLIIDFGSVDLCLWLGQELEAAARGIEERGGIVGHIKAALTISSTSMVSVTDAKAMTKEAPRKRARITLAAIVFMIAPEAAEEICRKALVTVRTRLRDSDGN